MDLNQSQHKKTPAIYDVVRKTPLELVQKLSRAVGCSVYLKREDMQDVHSFKIRGAYHKISQLTDKEKSAGVIAASAGNHAQGVALSAQKLGIKATIVMPKTTPDIKVDAVRAYGAHVVLHGDNYSEAQDKCNNLIKATGMTFVHPFDDPLVIEGQGTIADEILEQLPDVTHIFVCVGGGGMLAGIAQRVKRTHPHIKIISVEPSDSNAMKASIDVDERIVLPHVGIFADGVAVKQVGELTFELAKRYVDDFITVSIDELCAAIKSIYEDTRTVVEPAGALGVAGAKAYKLPKEAKAVAICSGANMSFERLQFIAERTLLGSGKEALYAVKLPEKAGALQTFCEVVVNDHNITEFSYRLRERTAAHFFVGVGVKNTDDRRNLETTMRENGYSFHDLTLDNLSKEHIRHMVGGVSAHAKNEVFYEIDFPERPQALQKFLNALGNSHNISLFHYRSLGGDTGRVMMGFECTEPLKLEKIFSSIGYHAQRAKSEAITLFLK